MRTETDQELEKKVQIEDMENELSMIDKEIVRKLDGLE